MIYIFFIIATISVIYANRKKYFSNLKEIKEDGFIDFLSRKINEEKEVNSIYKKLRKDLNTEDGELDSIVSGLKQERTKENREEKSQVENIIKDLQELEEERNS